MATSSTTWKPGTSGNPAGKAKAPSGRRSLRAALAEPVEPGASETVCDAWARQMVAEAETIGDRLALLRYIDAEEPRAES